MVEELDKVIQVLRFSEYQKGLLEPYYYRDEDWNPIRYRGLCDLASSLVKLGHIERETRDYIIHKVVKYKGVSSNYSWSISLQGLEDRLQFMYQIKEDYLLMTTESYYEMRI